VYIERDYFAFELRPVKVVRKVKVRIQKRTDGEIRSSNVSNRHRQATTRTSQTDRASAAHIIRRGNQ